MRVLVVGNGGREHALTWKLSQSPLVTDIFTAPGNPGTSLVPKNQNTPIASDDIPALLAFASTEGIDLTVVGPEKPLAEGIVDQFRTRDLRIFGPTKAAAQVEASKGFSKELMAEAKVPTAGFKRLFSATEACEHLSSSQYPLVLKADGLAAGKGVLVAGTKEEALTFVSDVMEKKIYGNAGSNIVAEEFLEGEEASFLVIAHGTDFASLASAQDHKRLLDGDQGPNTGGMGAYSPAPIFSGAIQKETEEKIVRPILQTLVTRKTPFTGILYAGLMLTKQGPKVLEFNARFGDPETEAILPRLESDLAELLLNATRGRLDGSGIVWKNESAMTVVLASNGYPQSPQTGKIVSGLGGAAKDAIVFHAGTKIDQGKIVTSGGRVFAITGLGKNLQEAQTAAYRAADKIAFEGKSFRKDIGWRAL